MYPDLLAETAPGVRKVWLSGGPDKSFSVQDFPGSHNATPFYSPQSHAIIDMNADLTAGELCRNSQNVCSVFNRVQFARVGGTLTNLGRGARCNGKKLNPKFINIVK